MTQVIPVTDARKNFLNLVDIVSTNYTRIDFTKKGVVKASLISPDYLDELEETIYTLTHSMDDIREAQKEIKEGKYVTLEQIIDRFNTNVSKTSYRNRKSR